MQALRSFGVRLPTQGASPRVITPLFCPRTTSFSRCLSGGATKEGKKKSGFRKDHSKSAGLHYMDEEPEEAPPAPKPISNKIKSINAKTTKNVEPEKKKEAKPLKKYSVVDPPEGSMIRMSDHSRAIHLLLQRLGEEGKTDIEAVEKAFPSKRAKQYEEDSGIRLTGQDNRYIYLELPQDDEARVVVRIPKGKVDADEYGDQILEHRLRLGEQERAGDDVMAQYDLMEARQKNMEDQPYNYVTLTFDVEIIPKSGDTMLVLCRNLGFVKELEILDLAFNDKPEFAVDRVVDLGDKHTFDCQEILNPDETKALERFLREYRIDDELGYYAKWLHFKFLGIKRQRWVNDLSNFLGGN